MVQTKEIPVTNLSKAVVDLLIGIPMFDQINSDELKIVAGHMHFMDFEPKEVIFSEGDNGDYVCFISEGHLEVLKENEKGKHTVIAPLVRGRSLGEMALLDDFTRSATVMSKTRSTLLILTRKSFEQLLERHPQIGIKMLKGFAKILSLNLRKASGLLADYMMPLG